MTENGEDQVVVRIDGLAYGGSAVGEVVEGAAERLGKKAFVRYAVPGEVVRAILGDEKRNLLFAEISSVEKTSPDRIEPACPYFGACGGCDLQHMTLDSQRQYKLKMVETTLARQAGLTPRLGVELIGEKLEGYGYRKRVALHLSLDGDLGFYRAQSGDVVDIEKCLISSDKINRMITQIRELREDLSIFIGGIVIDEGQDEVGVVLKLREQFLNAWKKFPRDLLDTLCKTIPHFVIHDRGKLVFKHAGAIDGEIKPHPIGHFSQVNQAGNELLVKAVCDLLKGETLTELYAGSGNFSLPLGRIGVSVDAIEVDRQLVNYGEFLLKREEKELPVNFVCMSSEEYVKTKSMRDTLLLDPPRSGAREVLSRLPKNVKKVVYVSCNLPTLVRDLKILSEQGFSLEKTYVLDMFSQTHHVEMVSVLVRG